MNDIEVYRKQIENKLKFTIKELEEKEKYTENKLLKNYLLGRIDALKFVLIDIFSIQE